MGPGGVGRGTEYATPGQKGKEWTRGQGKEARRVVKSKIAGFDTQKALTGFCRKENGAADFCIVLQDESSVISRRC